MTRAQPRRDASVSAGLPPRGRAAGSWLLNAKTAGVAAALVVFLLPILLVVFGSLKTTPDLIRDPLGLPTNPTGASFVGAFDKMNYLLSLWNTTWITTVSIFAISLFGSMAAYFLTRVAWAPNKFVFYMLVLAMIVPFQVLMIPMITILGSLGLLKTSLILPYIYLAAGTPLSVILYSGYIRSIPTELDEAAVLDGCNRRQIYFRVIFPLLRPMTLTVLVINVLFIWNDFLLPFLVLRRPEQRTLSLATLAFFQDHTTDLAPMMAALILAVLPVFVLYLFFQRHIVEGLVRGAVK